MTPHGRGTAQAIKFMLLRQCKTVKESERVG